MNQRALAIAAIVASILAVILSVGTAGAVSLNTIVVSKQVSLSGQTFGSVHVACPPGTQITGGGETEHSPTHTDFKIQFNEPTTIGQQMLVSGYSPSNTPEPTGAALEGYAVCATLTP